MMHAMPGMTSAMSSTARMSAQALCRRKGSRWNMEWVTLSMGSIRATISEARVGQCVPMFRFPALYVPEQAVLRWPEAHCGIAKANEPVTDHERVSYVVEELW
jgi:hypothetical protein